MSATEANELYARLKTERNPAEIRNLAKAYSKALGSSTNSLDDVELIVAKGALGAISALLAEQNARIIELESKPPST